MRLPKRPKMLKRLNTSSTWALALATWSAEAFSFVSGLSVDYDGNVLISYGAGDLDARVLSLSLDRYEDARMIKHHSTKNQLANMSRGILLWLLAECYSLNRAFGRLNASCCSVPCHPVHSSDCLTSYKDVHCACASHRLDQFFASCCDGETSIPRARAHCAQRHETRQDASLHAGSVKSIQAHDLAFQLLVQVRGADGYQLDIGAGIFA
eukprot:466742-Amphidinium_carterae.1